MRFTKADAIEQECWQMRLADQLRATRRALIDDLFNGFPPYSAEEVAQNKINVNSSFLEPSRIHSDATSQVRNALLSTSQYFGVKVDRGPRHRRAEYSEVITSELRKAMKEGVSALRYVEKVNNMASQLIVHGIGPTIWGDPERWCGSMQAIADVLIPSRTLLTMENLEHFAVYRRYTPGKLWQMTHGPNVDAGWNVKVAERAVDWALKQQTGTDSNDYSTGFSPERLAENVKENGGVWSTDQVPTINAFDFYFTDYDDDNFGWKRRIVLDCPDLGTGALSKDAKNILGERGKYLYNSGDKKYANKLSEIAHFQFSDGSVVAPFRYHSIRSLGFLLYSVCHLQNRLRCSFTEAAFEAAMQYFRASGSPDVDRILSINLTNRAVVPDGVQFIPPQERWQVNEVLLEKVLNLNKATIADSSTGYNRNFGHEEQRTEKTATQITAEVNASSALVGSMLQRLYLYQKYECKEIARRFCIPNSRDIDVRRFRDGCIKRGVPEDLLDSDCWEISVDQVMGNGNKQLAIAQAQMELAVIDRLEPDSQKKVLRNYFFAISSDATRADELVPMKPTGVNHSIHDSSLSATRMLLGLSMGLVQGVNHGEYAAELLTSMALTIQKIMARGGMATPDEIAGLQVIAGQAIDGQPIPNADGNPGNGAAFHIQILAQNKADQTQVKQLSDALGKLMNEVKGLAQRLEEQQGEQNGEAQPDLQAVAKAKATLMMAEVKRQTSAEKAADSRRQKAESHQQKLAEKAADAELQRALELRKAEVQTAATDLQTAAAIQRDALNGAAEKATAE